MRATNDWKSSALAMPVQPITAHLDQHKISPERSIQEHKPATPILERPSGQWIVARTTRIGSTALACRAFRPDRQEIVRH